MSPLKTSLLTAVNSALRPVDFRLVRQSKTFQDYIPFTETIAAAKDLGLSVGDYIDQRYNVPGSTQDTIDQMASLGVFERPTPRVCEIGPRSGRYLDKVIAQSTPEHYEIYETAAEWRDWLEETYPVVARPTDGMTLSATDDGSVDLVHTHKVLNGLKILDICRYFREMARVAAPHSVIVFDILTEGCLDEETLDLWLTSDSSYITSMTTEKFAVDFFTSRGFEYVGGFFALSLPGKTHYLVFRR